MTKTQRRAGSGFHSHDEVVNGETADRFGRASGDGVRVRGIPGPYINPGTGETFAVEDDKVQVRISGSAEAVQRFWDRVKGA